MVSGPALRLPRPAGGFRLIGSSTAARKLTTRAASSGPPLQSGGGDGEWWEQLRQNSIQGPAGEVGPKHSENMGSLAESLLGKTGFSQLENMDKTERQRVWDAMRGSAWLRYQKGEMPAWFDPDWLMQVCVCEWGYE